MKQQYICHTSTGTGHSCHSAGADRSTSSTTQEAPPRTGIDYSISPGVPCPETLLVVLMSNGSYLLVGYPQGGPTALVFQDDAGPLSQALEAAFGDPTDKAVTNGNSSKSKSSTNTTRRTEAVPEGVRVLPVRSNALRWLEGIPND